MVSNPASGWDGSDDTVSATYDWSSVRPSTAVVEVYAVATNQDPSTVEPLFDFVDPDALDTLVRSNGAASADDTVVSFTLSGRRITVDGSGTVTVRTETART